MLVRSLIINFEDAWIKNSETSIVTPNSVIPIAIIPSTLVIVISAFSVYWVKLRVMDNSGTILIWLVSTNLGNELEDNNKLLLYKKIVVSSYSPSKLNSSGNMSTKLV